MQYGQQPTTMLPGPETGQTVLDTAYTCTPEKATVAVEEDTSYSPVKDSSRTTVTSFYE
jgi:hypothetical protein